VTGLFWAGVIIAPAALVVFAPFATFLVLKTTGRSLWSRWIQELTGEGVGAPQDSGAATVMAVFFVVLSQSMATLLIVEGLGSDPFAGVALALGIGEWVAALVWVVLVIRASA
jgi:hypothetical protein